MKRGTFKIINKSDIDIYNPTNTISLLPDIKREDIISVSVNGTVEDKWIYLLNDIFMLPIYLKVINDNKSYIIYWKKIWMRILMNG